MSNQIEPTCSADEVRKLFLYISSDSNTFAHRLFTSIMVVLVHLLVCSHGLWGDPEHMATIAQIISETHLAQDASECELEILCAETNKSDYTFDGIGLSFARRYRDAYLTRVAI